MMKADLKRIVSVAFLDKFYIYYVESNRKILIRKEECFCYHFDVYLSKISIYIFTY